MLFQKPISPEAVEAYLNHRAPKKRSPIVPWVFALGGTGAMLLAAFGGPTSAESNQLLMLGGSACEALGLALLAPAAVKKILSL